MKIDNALLGHKDYALKIIKLYPEEFHRLPPEMRANREIVIEALEHSISTEYIFDLIKENVLNDWEYRFYKRSKK